MTERELDRNCAEYLAALTEQDFETLDQLWALAGSHPELEAAFRELNTVLDTEDAAAETNALTDAVRKHLPGVVIDQGKTGPVLLADAAAVLARTQPAPDELTAKLLAQMVEIPADMNLPKLIAWLEPRFGTAPKSYWKALYEAVVQLDLQRATEADYQMAARTPRSTP
jgi:hypothetical protein